MHRNERRAAREAKRLTAYGIEHITDGIRAGGNHLVGANDEPEFEEYEATPRARLDGESSAQYSARRAVARDAVITQQRLRELLHYDPATGVFTWLDCEQMRVEPGTPAGHTTQKGYVEIGVDGRHYKAHRLAWLYVHGTWPEEVDHINRVKGDNRIANLRDVGRCENMQNAVTGPKSRTGVRGVAHHAASGKFSASINRNRKKVWLGVFQTIEEAAAARRAAESQMDAPVAAGSDEPEPGVCTDCVVTGGECQPADKPLCTACRGLAATFARIESATDIGWVR